MRKFGAALLVAWGGLNAFGAMALSQDATRQLLAPSLFYPRWPFYDIVVFAALLTVTGGIALWLDRVWGLGVSIVGVIGLWGAPVYFEIHHFGWSGFEPRRLAFAVAILALPIASWLNGRSRPNEARYSPITRAIALSLPAFLYLILAFSRISAYINEPSDPQVVTVYLEPNAGERTLPSGHVVSIFVVKKTVVEGGSSTLHVEYETDIPVGDYVALVPEVSEVWSGFRRLAEAESVDSASIKLHGFGAGHDIYFPIRRDDGEWQVPTLLRLENGNRVVVYRVGENLDALWVDYVMAVPTRDHCVAVSEAIQVWSEYREIAESRGLRKAYLSPSLFPPRVIFSALAVRPFGFTLALTQSDDGQWFRGSGGCPAESVPVLVP